MNALFALALLASSSWAGVVMPVESGVAPAGPSATAVPVLAPAAGSLGAPSLGSAADLRGALPLLPAPVPGLAGPALNFVGNAPEAAAVHPEAGPARVAPAPATVRQGRAADQTPALPAKTSPGGGPFLAISLDRTSAVSAPGNGLSLSRGRGDEDSSNPLVESSSLEHAQPEKAAGLGRSFFDQSNEKNRLALANAAAPEPPSPIAAAAILEGGAIGPVPGGTARLSPRNAQAAFGAGHGSSQYAFSYAPQGETLRDAVAAAPGAAVSGGAAVFFRSASPNGELPASKTAVPALPSAPRPLALDLSRSGLIVRVRSALSGVLAPAQSAASSAPRLAAPGPSTALIERGAMLEAFSVAGDYAARAAAQSVSAARPLTAGALRTAVPFVPVPVSSTPPLWWAWFVLPLLAAAFRGL